MRRGNHDVDSLHGCHLREQQLGCRCLKLSTDHLGTFLQKLDPAVHIQPVASMIVGQNIVHLLGLMFHTTLRETRELVDLIEVLSSRTCNVTKEWQ